jgi:hypothetical protein
MKHYKDSQNKTYGFESGQAIPDGLTEITKLEADVLGVLNHAQEKEKEVENFDYVRQRIRFYPELGEFVDAWVKDDQVALEEYRQKCLNVKKQFPKPEGF